VKYEDLAPFAESAQDKRVKKRKRKKISKSSLFGTAEAVLWQIHSVR